MVDPCRPELESSARIRWERRRAAIGQAVQCYVRDPLRATWERLAGRDYPYPESIRYLRPALEEACFRPHTVYVQLQDAQGRRRFVPIGVMCLNCLDFRPRPDLHAMPGPLQDTAPLVR